MTELVRATPDYLQGVSREDAGLDDNFDASDVVIPSIRLLQGTSPQCADFDDAKAGVFWHTGIGEPLESFDFVVCSRRKKYLLRAPLTDDQGVLARAENGVTWDRMGTWTVMVDKKTSVTWTIDDLNVARSEVSKWGSHDPSDPRSPPAATLFYDYLVLLPNHLDWGPCVMSPVPHGDRSRQARLE